jgi:sucrose-6-phosphate hydrolase SacC (GH32 family)
MKQLILAIIMLASSAAFAGEGGFLFVTFKGEQTPLTEQIYFGLSRDGLQWEALHGGEPVLISSLGEKGVRDPYLLRSHDGKKFFILATDLSIHRNGNWTRATHAGSKSLVIWESADLVHWSEPRLVSVAAADAGCTWAPEAVYDDQTHDYLVFWASTTKSDGFAKQRIWAARTTDFRTFSKPFIYIDKPRDVIDTDIVRAGETYYRFSKDETFKAITMERSDKLMGPWKEMPEFSLAKLTGYEGPEGFQLQGPSEGKPAVWGLLLDHYSRGDGYKLFVTHDLSTGQFTPVSDVHFPFLFRHGFPLAISTEEYDRLKTAYP